MWNESFYLYVSDPSSATLAFTALDRDMFSDDDFLGVGSMSVADLRALSVGENGVGTVTAVPVPLYMDTEGGGGGPLGMGWPFPARRRLKRTGTLEVDVRFVPWARDGAGERSSGEGEGLDFAWGAEGLTDAEARLMQRSFRALPRGASPGLVDWPALTQTVVNAAGPGAPTRHRLSTGLARRRLAQVHAGAHQPLCSASHQPPSPFPLPSSGVQPGLRAHRHAGDGVGGPARPPGHRVLPRHRAGQVPGYTHRHQPRAGE